MNSGTNKWHKVGLGLSVVAVLPFLPSVFMKLTMNPMVLDGMTHFGFAENLIRPLGMIEFLCVLTYLVPRTAILGAILLTGYLGGAICTHMRVGEALYMPLLIGIAVWAGVYLRDARLRELLPFRK